MKTYAGEVERIAAAVEGGADLYEAVVRSDCVGDPEWFGAVMRSTDYPDEYANMLAEPMEPADWEACASYVVFFAMCADVRERLHP